MKINIWIKKEDAISGNITKYYLNQPLLHDYVQVEITQDEFAQLEDKSVVNEMDDKLATLVKKYNTIKGGDFPEFWKDLTTEQQIQLAEYYEWK